MSTNAGQNGSEHTDAASVYTTTDDEREAREIAENLWLNRRRRAIVMSVNELARLRDPKLLNPGALRTSNRYAVIAEVRG